MKFFRLDSTLKVMDEVFKKIKVTFPQLEDKVFNVSKILNERLNDEQPFINFNN